MVDRRDMQNAITINEFMLNTLGSIQEEKISNAKALNDALGSELVFN